MASETATRAALLGIRHGRESNYDQRCRAVACLREDDARTAWYLLGPKHSASAPDAPYFEALL